MSRKEEYSMRPVRYLLGCVAVAGLLTLAACGSSNSSGGGGSGGSAAKSDNKLEVFSWWTSGSEDAELKALMSSFTAANPGVKITNGAVAGGGGSNAQAVLQTRLQGSNAPDTWQTHPGDAVAQYVDAGYVADLTDVYKANDLTAVMPKELVDAQSKDGKVYGIATGAHRGNVLWFNKKLLEKAGVATPAADYSSDQFLADLGKLKAKGITPLCVGAKDAFAAPQLFENTLLGTVGPQKWNDLTTGKLSWDSAEVKQAATTFAQLLPFIDPDASATTWDQATKGIADGKCAFESMGDWAYGELKKAGVKDGTDFGYVPHPGTNGSFVMVVDTFVVAKNAKDPNAARKWIADIGTKDAQLAFNKEKGSTPVRTDVDVSSFPPYQQQAAKDYRGNTKVWSIVHGQATSPQFQQSLYDAVTQFMQSKDVNAFVQSLKTAAS
jgi:glucose/mannose transport system substrate-binding protein